MKIFVVILLMSASPVAFGALGDREASLEKDRQALSGGSLKIIRSNPAFTIHEMTSHGNTIREYINAEGTVFAVSWRGIKEPDLSVLLGTHFQEYQAASVDRKKAKGRKSSVIKTSNITVHKGGHMRDLRGKAYLTALLPAGVKVEDLQ